MKSQRNLLYGYFHLLHRQIFVLFFFVDCYGEAAVGVFLSRYHKNKYDLPVFLIVKYVLVRKLLVHLGEVNAKFLLELYIFGVVVELELEFGVPTESADTLLLSRSHQFLNVVIIIDLKYGNGFKRVRTTVGVGCYSDVTEFVYNQMTSWAVFHQNEDAFLPIYYCYLEEEFFHLEDVGAFGGQVQLFAMVFAK